MLTLLWWNVFWSLQGDRIGENLNYCATRNPVYRCRNIHLTTTANIAVTLTLYIRNGYEIWEMAIHLESLQFNVTGQVSVDHSGMIPTYFAFFRPQLNLIETWVTVLSWDTGGAVIWLLQHRKIDEYLSVQTNCLLVKTVLQGVAMLFFVLCIFVFNFIWFTQLESQEMSGLIVLLAIISSYEK